MGEILRSAARDNPFTRFWGMTKQIGRQGLTGIEETLGVSTDPAKSAELDERLRKVNEELEKTRAAKEKIARIDDTSLEDAKNRQRIEAEYQKLLVKQAQYKKELRELDNQRQDVYKAADRVDREFPTVAELAGRDREAQVAKIFGQGGEYDLSAGDGPFAQIAQESEYFKNKQKWDLIHGNAIWNEKGELIGGAAFDDRLRQIAADNRLGAAGLDTPAMKFEEMKQHLSDINSNIAAILSAAKADGLHIKIPDDPN